MLTFLFSGKVTVKYRLQNGFCQRATTNLNFSAITAVVKLDVVIIKIIIYTERYFTNMCQCNLKKKQQQKTLTVIP